MVYGMVCRIWQDRWYGIVYGVAWRDDMYMVWPGRHGMVYGMIKRAWHGLAGMAWYMVTL